MKAKILNILLLITFVLTIMAPLTGIMIHKMVSVLFLLLSLIHTIIYRKKMNWKRFLVLGVIVLAFVSGILGMFFDYIPMVSAFHTAISIASVFFLAIHIFVYYRKINVLEKIEV